MKKIRTRFAPSPTGMLHIGGARTALFSKLWAHHNGGDYVLRIEDTDRARSTQEAVDAIKDGLNWLGLGPDDGTYIFQTENEGKHVEAVEKMLANGTAYYCYVSPEELDAIREEQRAAGKMPMYDGRHRTLTAQQRAAFEAEGRKPVVRLLTPDEGHTAWHDAVQGEIRIPNSQLDDLVLLRSDGTPTYNLAVVVDDILMGVTDVIRGDDHINNTPKQILIYKALGADIPTFAHLPLIHDKTGKKMSKRNGDVDVFSYHKKGYLPEALLNYLMRLGWSMGDQEVISWDEAVKAFDLQNINKGASVFDFDKLDWLNGEYIKNMGNKALLEKSKPFFKDAGFTLDTRAEARLLKIIDELKPRARKLTDLVEGGKFCLSEGRPSAEDEKAQSVLLEGSLHLQGLAEKLAALSEGEWQPETLDATVKTYVQESGAKFPQVGMPVRVALTGTTHAPGIGAILSALGKEESLKRMTAA